MKASLKSQLENHITNFLEETAGDAAKPEGLQHSELAEHMAAHAHEDSKLNRWETILTKRAIEQDAGR